MKTASNLSVEQTGCWVTYKEHSAILRALRQRSFDEVSKNERLGGGRAACVWGKLRELGFEWATLSPFCTLLNTGTGAATFIGGTASDIQVLISADGNLYGCGEGEMFSIHLTNPSFFIGDPIPVRAAPDGLGNFDDHHEHDQLYAERPQLRRA